MATISRGGVRARGDSEAKVELVLGYWLSLEVRTCGTVDSRRFPTACRALVAAARGDVLEVKRRLDAAFADQAFRDSIGVTPVTVLRHWLVLGSRRKVGA